MTTFQTNYQSLENDEIENSPESVIVHTASEGSKSRWNHIDDLDSFFSKVYKFHQQHGFVCIITREITDILLFCCVGCLLLYSSSCIYFNFDEPPLLNHTDIQLSDLFIPVSECVSNYGFVSWLCLVLFILVMFGKIYKFIRVAYSFKEIEQFYEHAMKIPKNEIHNVTWYDVMSKLREVQHEQQMCVHKSELTELDIYHRILRRKNYMVALVNKNILPVQLNIPFLGKWFFFSPALEYNIELLLFGTGLSPFNKTGTLKEEYKKHSKRLENAEQVKRNILIIGLMNIGLAPFTFVWQLFFYFFQYSGILRYEPGFFSTRRWSPYSRLYLRHFNELDHELNARLNRAYKPAKEYMKCFTNPVGGLVFDCFRKIFCSLVVFFVIWGLFKEKLLLMDHVLLIIGAGSLIFYGLSGMIPDENAVFYPQLLMQRMIADIHYVPDHFKTQAHTTNVRDEFSHLFPYNMVDIAAGLLSPIICPYILLVHLYPKALEIVDFLRCFTVEVAGVGDVCSFALMDVSKHGNQNWVGPRHQKITHSQQAEDGKTELSLIHFKMMNPHWVPPDPSNRFYDDFKEQVLTAKGATGDTNVLYNSLNSVSTIGSRYASLANNMHHLVHPHTGSTSFSVSNYNRDHMRMKGGLCGAEGPPFIADDAFPSLTANEIDAYSVQDLNPMELRAAEMSLSALLLHEVHDKYIGSTRAQTSQPQSVDQEGAGNEEVPLLDIRR